ncbi:MAG: transposase [Rubripirellula sp.]
MSARFASGKQLGQLFYNDSEFDMTKVNFRPLDRGSDVRISGRNLPHWFQANAAVFVTFRSIDSMPADVVVLWQRELEHWLGTLRLPTELAASVVMRRAENHEALLETLDAKQQREFKRLSDRVFHRSLDECYGACVLRQPPIAKIVGDAVRFFDGDKYDLDRFVVMPNHVHAIVQFRTGATLSMISESWMRYTARLINKEIGATGPFWQPEPFDHVVRSAEQFSYLQTYIAENPKKANLKANEALYWQRPE